MLDRWLRRIAVPLLIVCVVLPFVLMMPRGTSFLDLPSRAPRSIRSCTVDVRQWPWGTGVYGAAGDELYWFFRIDPKDRDRGFGTERFDKAETNVWNFAVLRDGNVEVLGRYQSLFSGAVLLSDLRAAADGSLYVAIAGHYKDPAGRVVTGEVVRLSRNGSAKRIWTGNLGDWPDVHVVSDDVMVDASYDYLRLSLDGEVRESKGGIDLYHATSCMFEGALWMNTGRRLRRGGKGRPLDLVPGLLPETHYDCASSRDGIAVIVHRSQEFLAARASGKRKGPLVRLDERRWALSSQGPVVAAWVHGASNTLLIGNANGFWRLRLPDTLRGFRVPQGTSGDALFLLTDNGYSRVGLPR